MIKCHACGKSRMGPGAEKEGWLVLREVPWVDGPIDLCPVDKDLPEYKKSTQWGPDIIGGGQRAQKDIVGFDKPEDGSEDRYAERRKQVPWLSHTIWWFVHNAIAHPLIAVLPIRPLFRFHDWTSHKMHGE
jgi:hypothetical protein